MSVVNYQLEEQLARIKVAHNFLKSKGKSIFDEYKPVVSFESFEELKKKLEYDLKFQIQQVSYRDFKEIKDNVKAITLFEKKIGVMFDILKDIENSYGQTYYGYRIKEVEKIAKNIEKNGEDITKTLTGSLIEVSRLFDFIDPRSRFYEEADTSFFYISNGLNELKHFLMAKDTIQNGAPENKMFDNLVKRALVECGEGMVKGYPKDLLVHDRQGLNNPHIIFDKEGNVQPVFIQIMDKNNSFSTYIKGGEAAIKDSKAVAFRIMPSESNIETANTVLEGMQSENELALGR
jgi:hypothetical protein